MSHEPLPEDKLDAFVTQQLRNSAPYLADDGFIEKTLQALPAVPRPRRTTSKAWWLTGLFGASVATLALLSGVPTIFQWANRLTTTDLIQLGVITSAITFGSALLWFGRELDLI